MELFVHPTLPIALLPLSHKWFSIKIFLRNAEEINFFHSSLNRISSPQKGFEEKNHKKEALRKGIPASWDNLNKIILKLS